MAVQGRRGWLFVAVVCAATVAGCGSESTGETSPDAVIKTVRTFAGPNAKVYQSRVLVNPDTGGLRWMPMVVACKPEDDCEVIAPDGAGYPDLQAFVDDSKLLKSGDEVGGDANITSPGEPTRFVTFRRADTPPWGWYAGGSALLALLIVVLLVSRMRRRRQADASLAGQL
jgi:hypothetical protein